jgi:type IV pilus assembly protein PilO
MIKFSEKSKKEQQKILILAILLSLVICVAYVGLFLRPQAARLGGVMGQVKKVKADLKAAKANIARIDSFKKSIEAYNEKVGRYEKTLPTEQGIPRLLEDLSTMARDSNMKIVGIVPVSQEDIRQRAQTYQEIPIMISAKSGYHELGRFLAGLENSDRFMKVADIQIRSNRSAPKKHDVELLVLTYVLLEGK